MNPILQTWNDLDSEDAAKALLHCCSARRWAEGISALRPFADAETLFNEADRVWSRMEEPDWMEAFRSHPRIGGRKATYASPQSSAWSSQEQASASHAQGVILDQLADGNARYEESFGFTYIVCATGKSAEEMLRTLYRRLDNDKETEIKEAAEQQRQIMQIRLRKWLQQ
jgi:2-oxo-4-hydroxy-4-carboxy-5-ureidoimidazoline decarboxylase